MSYVVIRRIRVEAKKSDTFKLKSVHRLSILDAIVSQSVRVDRQRVLIKENRLNEGTGE